MRVCYWTPSAGGGAGKYEYFLPREMEEHGVDVRVYSRPSGSTGNPFTLRLSYKSNGDIVHATSQTLSIYSYPKPEKFLVTVHDVYTLHKSLLSKLKRMLIRRSLKRADRVIAPSEFTKEEIKKYVGINNNDIKVIPMGVDRSLYKPMDGEDCKEKLGLKSKNKHILVVASNHPHKRMDLTKAVFEMVKDNSELIVKLLKVGYGSELDGEGIINMGFIPEKEMPILYNAADVLLHTSEYEGFGMPLLEAMACGSPVVVSNKASIPEVVGDCGELVDLDSEDCVEQFVEKVLDCIGSDERNQEGIERSRQFSWGRTAKETMKVYEELL